MDVPPSLPAERRIVSVLFADLVGSTSVAEKLDPEDWADVAGSALAAMSAAAERFGGVVARLMGDGILALFGAPVATEDDAERAVRAGLEMAALGDRLRTLAGTAGASLAPDHLQVRVGIATGEVLAGVVGSPGGSSEYTVLGDAANLAARLEKLAPPGGVLVADATRTAVGPGLEVEPRHGLAVRGREEAVDAYLVCRIGTSDGRRPRAGAFVGREQERERLVEAVDRCVAGEGSIVTLRGDGGIGKSRLLDEVESSVRGRYARLGWVRTSVSSYESGVAYGAVRRILEGLSGLADLEEHLRAAPTERAVVTREALAALGADTAGATDAESLGVAVSEVVGAVVAARGAAVVAVDDAHWADSASVELFASLLPLTERLPLSILLAFRPESTSPVWGLRHLVEAEFPHRHTDLYLGPLTGEQAREVVRGVGASAEAVDELVARGGGNPFFLEELGREASETGGGQRVPATLQRLMQARFDRISGPARSTLETAAVAGEAVTEQLLETVTGRAVADDLHELMRSGLLLREPGRNYRFVHALAREAAYAAMSRRRRRQLHAVVAATLEAGGTAAPALLARQFREAGDTAGAVRHGLRAADEAARLGAFVDAIRQYDEALATEPEEAPVLARLLLGRGRSRDVAGDIDGAIADLERARSLVSDDETEWRVTVALGEAWAARDYRRTGEHFLAALESARRTGDDSMVGTSLNRLGNWYANAVDPGTALDLHSEALVHFDRIDSVAGRAATHDLLGMAALLGGRFGEAHSSFRVAAEEFGLLDDVRGRIGALVGSATGAPMYQNLYVPFVEPVDALAWLDEAVTLARSIGWASGEAFALFMRSQVRASTGMLGAGLADARAALDIARRTGHHQWELASLLCLSAAAGDALDPDTAQEAAEEAVRRADRLGSPNWVLEVASVAARAHLERGRAEEAEALLVGALGREGADRFGGWRMCRAMLAWSAVLRGQPDRARSLLAEVEGPSPVLSLIAGRAALAADDLPSALAHFEHGASAADRWGMAPLAWRLHLAALGAGGGEEHRVAADLHASRCADSLPDGDAARFRRQVDRMVGGDERSPG